MDRGSPEATTRLQGVTRSRRNPGALLLSRSRRYRLAVRVLFLLATPSPAAARSRSGRYSSPSGRWIRPS